MSTADDPMALDVYGVVTHPRGRGRTYIIDAGQHALQISVSATGRKVRVWIDGNEAAA